MVLFKQDVGLHDLPRTLPANTFYDYVTKVRKVHVGDRELHRLHVLNSRQRFMTLSDKDSHIVLFFRFNK